jgi:uncharacterized protein
MTDAAIYAQTARTVPSRYRERASYERATAHAIIDEAYFCHLGFVVDGEPRMLPTLQARIGDTLYLHGSSANRALLAAAGQDICVTVTHLDGLVCARAVFHHSMNYRSAMAFGTARLVTEDSERLAALHAVTEQLAPGRWDHSRLPTRKELAATAVLALPLDEASVKIRTGPPKDDPEDYQTDYWAGVLPAALTFGEAQPDPKLRQGVPAPAHITAMAGRVRSAGRFA